MTPILPHEIWRHIAKYVPTDCYQNILSVNPPLFDFVMDERYRYVRLHNWDAKTFRLLDRLQDSDLAERVRSLSINPSARLEHAVLITIPSVVLDIRRAICEAVSKMSRLTEYSVIYSPPEIFTDQLMVDVLPEFTAFSPQFRQNLQTLSLRTKMSDIVALNLHAVDFPCLQTFDLETTDSDPEFENTESPLITTLVPFLHRCRPTLKCLSIAINMDLDRSPFLDLLGVFPNLVSVSVQFELQHRDISCASTIKHFLNRHAETLRSLVFKPRSYLERIGIIFSKIDLPRLQELKVELGRYSTPIVVLERCIRPFTNTLTTIDLTRERLYFDDLQIVSSLFAQEPPILKTASFSLPVLSPRAVDLLANKLQGLQDLTLLFPLFESDAEIVDMSNNCDAEGRFCQEMEKRWYPNWRLRNVALLVEFCCGTVCSWRAMKVLAKAVPSLQSFNGQGDLSVSEKWGDSGVYTVMQDACECIGRFGSRFDPGVQFGRNTVHVLLT